MLPLKDLIIAGIVEAPVCNYHAKPDLHVHFVAKLFEEALQIVV